MENDFKISLRAARINKNLKLNEVAELIQVSRHTLINWEKGKNGIPYCAKVVLSDLYGVKFENLI